MQEIGIVCWDDRQGDATISLLDKERWEQIFNIPDSKSWKDIIGYLVMDDASQQESDKPKSCPAPVGKVLHVSRTQNGVFELTRFTDVTIIGFLTLSGY